MLVWQPTDDELTKMNDVDGRTYAGSARGDPAG